MTEITGRLFDAIEDQLRAELAAKYSQPKYPHKTTNRDFAKSGDPLFMKSCELAHVPPTKRQVSKWRMGRGLAYEHRNAAKAEVAREVAARLTGG